MALTYVAPSSFGILKHRLPVKIRPFLVINSNRIDCERHRSQQCLLLIDVTYPSFHENFKCTDKADD